MGENTEPERTRPFTPGDNAVSLDSIDWKTRYNELKKKDWDPEKQFVGIKRLGDSYHPLEPFFKFDGVPPEKQLYDKLWWPMLAGGGGTIIAACSNWWARRPFWSAVPNTVATGAFMVGLSLFLWENSRRRAAERDAVLVHYMILHENDFPRIERKRFGQILKPWYPNRLGQDGLFNEE